MMPEAAAVSETAILLNYQQTISREVFLAVSQHTAAIKALYAEVLVDIVPAYASILLVFDLQKVRGEALKKKILELLAETKDSPANTQAGQQVEIPVYYGEEVAPDLVEVAAFAEMSTAEVIALHSGQSYDVYATGFAPGFAYLGIVDARIAMARKATPRTYLPAGSVGIAGAQTAVYPADSPGGWQIVGRTPLAMVDFSQTPFARVQTGDTVRFKPISREAFIELGGKL